MLRFCISDMVFHAASREGGARRLLRLLVESMPVAVRNRSSVSSPSGVASFLFVITDLISNGRVTVAYNEPGREVVLSDVGWMLVKRQRSTGRLDCQCQSTSFFPKEEVSPS